jgi:hypothetical protein
MRADGGGLRGARDALALELSDGVGGERPARLGERAKRIVPRRLHGLLARRADVGEPHAVGREQR